jgi:hypothetical protein
VNDLIFDDEDHEPECKPWNPPRHRFRFFVRKLLVWALEGDFDKINGDLDVLADQDLSTRRRVGTLENDSKQIKTDIRTLEARIATANTRAASASGGNESTQRYVAALWADFHRRDPENAKKAMDVVTGAAVIVDRGRGFEIEKAPVGSAEYDAKQGLADAQAKARGIRTATIGERLALEAKKGGEE